MRIQKAEQKFEQKKSERERYIVKAEECLTEMNRLQGAWAELMAIQEEEAKPTIGVKVKDEGKKNG